MKHCNKCNLDVNTFKKTCPLCGELLDSDSEQSAVVLYPKYRVKAKKKNMALRVILFLLIVASITTVIANYYTFETFSLPWSAIVVASAIYIWILLRHTIMSKHIMAKRFVVLSITTTILFIIIDLVSLPDYKLSWSIDYMLPFVMIASIITILFILFIKKIKYRSYLLHLFASIFLGLIPLLLLILKVTSVDWPSLTSGCLSIVTFIGLFIFADEQTKTEIKKRFHI